MTSGDSRVPLIVCTHGGAMDHRMWDSQRDAFRQYTGNDLRRPMPRVIDGVLPRMFSLDEAADDLVALIHTTERRAAVLVGHSVGASISQLVALHHPERVTAMVGIGAACMTIPATATARVRQAANPLPSAYSASGACERCSQTWPASLPK